MQKIFFSIIFLSTFMISCNNEPLQTDKYYKFITSQGKTLLVKIAHHKEDIIGFILTDQSIDSIKITGKHNANGNTKLFEYSDDGDVTGIYELDFSKNPIECFWSKTDGSSKVVSNRIEIDSTEFMSFSKKLVEKAKAKRNESSEISSNFWGKWRADCERSGSITINKYNPIKIEVNSNQIFIKAIAKIDEAEPMRMLVYFQETADLGRGGMNLSWSNFSTNKPIATLQFLPSQKDKLHFIWFGFYNEATKQYEWKTQADWNNNDVPFNNTLLRCFE
jgi:hypothetical protein